MRDMLTADFRYNSDSNRHRGTLGLRPFDQEICGARREYEEHMEIGGRHKLILDGAEPGLSRRVMN